MADASDLVLYNTLSKKEERFVPGHAGRVNMFVCGQTVYDDAHLGHAKNYINFSVVARWLRHLNYSVMYVQNITDVDDKIIARARESGQDPIELARHFESRFLEDMESLDVKRDVDSYPRSHDYIEAIRVQVQQLLDMGYAYLLDGDVYYDVSRFKGYTALSGIRIDELARHRIEPKEGKRNPYDFALWKAAKPGEPSWKIKVSEAGKTAALDGRPGWHIEDTAITSVLFGPQYDIHGGATDLIFPHHTNEIAQAEAASGMAPFVRYWMHSGVLKVNGEKMSKSLGNFVRIRDLLKAHSAEALRLLVCSTHYRKEIDYTEKLMAAAEKRLRYIYGAFCVFYNMKESSGAGAADIDRIAGDLDRKFTAAMNSDLNTSLALTELCAAIESLKAFAESHEAADADAKARASEKVLELAGIFGILRSGAYKTALPEDARRLIAEREALRDRKLYTESDAVRDRLLGEYGIVVEDSEYGTIWYRNG
jgi:cysteinyl-tRNA synthetase